MRRKKRARTKLRKCAISARGDRGRGGREQKSEMSRRGIGYLDI